MVTTNKTSAPGDYLPHWVDDAAQAQRAARSGDSRAVWIVRKSRLADQLVRQTPWPSHRMGHLLLLHRVRPEILPALMRRFQKVVYATAGGAFMPAQEIADVLKAPDRRDRFIGGTVDRETRTVILWRGDLTPLIVPFSAFPPTANGIRPRWDRFSVTDFGHTIAFGEYEAAADAILYEFDSEFRRRLKKSRIAAEQTLGASIRRLRMQRQLTRRDFAGLDPKTLARIERGQVEKPHADTLKAIARRLGVESQELGQY